MEARLSSTGTERDDLSINVLELLGMVVRAWAFVEFQGVRPRFEGESILLKGDNMSAIH